ncbi:MAG: hypothetical protein IJS93_03400 [Clostridia bacterium]|nr:hypothetical protein [Clostridia bacterium]
MKKLLLFTLMILILACVACSTAYAEEENMTEYFKDVWLDKLVNFLSVAAGVICSVSALLYKASKATKSAENTLVELKDKEVNLAVIIKELEKTRSQNAELNDICSELLATKICDDEKRDVEVEKIKRMLFILATNNGELVKKGYAKEIAEVAGYDEEK